MRASFPKRPAVKLIIPMAYSKEDKFRRREQDLKERELEIRLRELEHEIEKTNQPPAAEPETARSVEVTTDEPNAKPPRNRRMRKLMNMGKLFVLMVVMVAAMRIAYWLAMAIMVGTIAFTAYMLFIKE